MLERSDTTALHTPARRVVRIVLGLAYVVAGIGHIILMHAVLTIMPPWVPEPRLVIALTGLAEIAGGAALFVPSLRRAAGVGLALYAVCVYPANVKHAMDYFALTGWGPGWWYHAPRLAFQPVIVWWALWASGVIDWPFRKTADTQTPAE